MIIIVVLMKFCRIFKIRFSYVAYLLRLMFRFHSMALNLFIAP